MKKTLPWIILAAIVAALVWLWRSRANAPSKSQNVPQNTGSARSLLDDIFGIRARSQQIAAANTPADKAAGIADAVGVGVGALGKVVDLFRGWGGTSTTTMPTTSPTSTDTTTGSVGYDWGQSPVDTGYGDPYSIYENVPFQD